MVSKDEFIEYLKTLIEEDVNGKKYISESYINKVNLLIKVGIILFVISFLLFFIIPIMPFIGIIVLSIGLIMKSKTTAVESEIASKYKDEIIKYLLKDYKYTYDKNDYIEERIFEKSRFIDQSIDEYKGEDLISINIPNDDGSESETDLVMSDLHVIHEGMEDDNGKRAKYVIYDSVFGYIKFPFKFKCTLLINTIGYKANGLKSVQLEDIVFNEKFKIYSTDQIEARYILTPVMMQKLLDLRKRLGEVSLVMSDDIMYLSFKYKKLFQLKGAKNGHLYQMFTNLYDDVELIISLVKEIQTNNKVFKM